MVNMWIYLTIAVLIIIYLGYTNIRLHSQLDCLLLGKDNTQLPKFKNILDIKNAEPLI
jgi:hypothetical protein